MANWLITGANRGIGLELARRAREEGQRLIVTARKPKEASELAALGVDVRALDVASDESVSALARDLAGVPIDVLVNNAGVMGRSVPFESIDTAEILRTIDINALGALRVTRALLPNLRLGRGRKVAQMTSKMGSIADNTSGGAYAYRMSKAALNMMNKSLALDLSSEGFVCLVLHPGWVRTKMGGTNAPLEPSESASGLYEVIANAKSSANGSFLDWRGEQIPW